MSGKFRWKRGGSGPIWSRLKFMAEAEGYVMVRYHGSVPHAITRKEWDSLPAEPPPDAETYPARRATR